MTWSQTLTPALLILSANHKAQHLFMDEWILPVGEQSSGGKFYSVPVSPPL